MLQNLKQSLFQFVLLGFTIIGLSACDVANTFIPPVTSNNLLGFESSTITLTIGQDAEATIGTQTATGSSETIVRSFSDLSALSADPKDLYLELRLGPTVELIAPAEHPACNFDIVNLSIDVLLSDGTQVLDLPRLKLNKRVQLEPTANSNEYRVISEDTVLSADVSREDVAAFVALVTSGGINTLEARVSTAIFSAPEIPAGSQLSFSIISDEGTFSF